MDEINQELEGLPPWLATMRRAAMEAVSTEDVKAMVAKQVELAKNGDRSAMKFVFDHVLGGNAMKGATFIQNNYQGVPAEDLRKTNALPGSARKIKTMQARMAAGLPLQSPADNDGADLS